MAKLLVVDDDQDIRDLVVKRLMREGHEVLAADSGATALVLAQQHGPPDVAVLDLDMPGMDGFELHQHLCEAAPQLPTLFLTVLWFDDVYARIEQVRGRHLAKPFTAAGLIGAVRELLDASDRPGRGPGGAP